ncbi:MAG: DMT family transporter [Muribaculaceae bacterium]|nr:DMT family transporter [Muribaculaceae bacterium]
MDSQTSDTNKSAALEQLRKSRIKGNLAMFAGKTFSGLNQNALRYLLPRWMNAGSGVVLRLVFGSLFFWILGIVKPDKTEKVTARDRLLLLLTGIITVFGYMFTLLKGLTYTTPISSSIFIALQASVVYIICLILRTERLSAGRVAGIILGIGGALVCILTQKHSDVASAPLAGNLYCLASTVLFASYLVIEKRYLKRLSNATVSKYTFTGGLITALIVLAFTGDWYAPVLTKGLFTPGMAVLAFVLIFPTALSYLLTDIGLKNLPATVVALYANWILIVAAIASYILGQDRFSWWQIISITLMIASVYLVEKDESSDRRKQA